MEADSDRLSHLDHRALCQLTAFPRPASERLLDDLSRIRKRLGGERQQRVAGLIERAFAEQAARGDNSAHRDWIRLLLTDYYDPMYEYQMSRREGRRLFRGTREAVVAYAAAELGGA